MKNCSICIWSCSCLFHGVLYQIPSQPIVLIFYDTQSGHLPGHWDKLNWGKYNYHVVLILNNIIPEPSFFCLHDVSGYLKKEDSKGKVIYS